ncbi:hypothetical protein [Lepagella muris]|jgi:hypothetical protein|uniref:Uncharacterized protein n=1 Tax=Lepagella muris TaxID=3032870 RepID=A0AC61RJ43_9BACT|nr:hypothetical protein [Lepagella muris]ROT08377.1 hypothetical protein EEL33_04810 [Muribaculaceae bacterium Isolate-037 (Harlan)]TGY79767.1 hypothetical protein E5331_05165 [Lepagella muris]THG51829.1 hypothetical protein E5984_09985 [Bacteroidales bacterium]TKC55544.1 hypothetical protein E5359_014885 [Bacteroidales bacterium]
MAESKKELTVRLHVREMMYDITNKAYLTGRAREAEKTKDYEAASNMQASEDEEDSSQLRRSMAAHFTALKSLLGEYLNEDKTTTDNLINEEIDKDTTLELCFRLPSNYNNASADSLGKGIHSYIVHMTLGDWFTITNKADAKEYFELAQVSLDNVKRALYKRSRPVRPTYASGGGGA